MKLWLQSKDIVFTSPMSSMAPMAPIDLMAPKPMNANFYANHIQSNPFSSHHKFDDPSEPIYTDPSLFERSRSLRSVTISNLGDIRSQ